MIIENIFGLANDLTADGQGSEIDAACLYLDQMLSDCFVTEDVQYDFQIPESIADEINDELRDEIHMLQDMRDALEVALEDEIDVNDSAAFMSVFNWK